MVLTFQRLRSQECPMQLAGHTLACHRKHWLPFQVCSLCWIVICQPAGATGWAEPRQIHQSCRVGQWLLPQTSERHSHTQRRGWMQESPGEERQCSVVHMVSFLSWMERLQTWNRLMPLFLFWGWSMAGATPRLSPVPVLRERCGDCHISKLELFVAACKCRLHFVFMALLTHYFKKIRGFT